MPDDKFKQETISIPNYAKRLNELDAEGWEYADTLEHRPPRQYDNGHYAGPACKVVLFRRKP